MITAPWVDFDDMAFNLGKGIGIFPPESTRNDYKGVFWSANPLGEALSDALQCLVVANILEYDDGRYRIKEREITYGAIV